MIFRRRQMQRRPLVEISDIYIGSRRREAIFHIPHIPSVARGHQLTNMVRRA